VPIGREHVEIVLNDYVKFLFAPVGTGFCLIDYLLISNRLDLAPRPTSSCRLARLIRSLEVLQNIGRLDIAEFRRKRIANLKSDRNNSWVRAERAADYDAQGDAEKRRAHLEGIQALERKRLQGQLAVQERLEELVWSLEAQLDQMGRLPLTGYTLRTREVEGKKVVATETQVQAINLRAYVAWVALRIIF
jgi:hypothetical protein